MQMHFRNHCLDFLGKFSCAIDCFLEFSCYIFKDAIACVECNFKFFEMIYTACVQVNSDEIFVRQLGLVREPVWAWMRQCCSFTDMSANAVFSDIFQVNTFGELTFDLDLKSLFPIQHTNHSINSQCNNRCGCPVNYPSTSLIHQNGYESSVSEVMLPNINKRFCVHCQNHSGRVALLH